LQISHQHPNKGETLPEQIFEPVMRLNVQRIFLS